MSENQDYRPSPTEQMVEKESSEQTAREAFLHTLAEQFADSLHQDWQSTWKAGHGDESKMKNTSDADWIKTHGTPQVDIANTNFLNLPKDWQADNRASAVSAMREVVASAERGSTLGEDFVTSASEVVHADWLFRNGATADPDQYKIYEELRDSEQEQDRKIVRKAIDFYRKQQS